MEEQGQINVDDRTTKSCVLFVLVHVAGYGVSQAWNLHYTYVWYVGRYNYVVHSMGKSRLRRVLPSATPLRKYSLMKSNSQARERFQLLFIVPLHDFPSLKYRSTICASCKLYGK